MPAIPASKRTVLLRDYSGFSEFAAFGDAASGGSWDWLIDLGKTALETTPQIISAVSGTSTPARPPTGVPAIPPRATSSSGMPSWIVPAGIGVGALILIFAMKKK